MKPCWNIVSLALPAAALFIGTIAMNASGPRGGDFAGALGGVIRLTLAMGVVSLAGEAAAIAALVRGERLMALSLAGVILNAVVILAAAYLASRID